MSQTTSEDNSHQEISNVALPKARAWFTSFRRIQLAFGVWGILMIIGGLLQSNYSKTWGIATILWIWAGLTVLGLIFTYLLDHYFLNSGMLVSWATLMILGLALTFWLVLGFNLSGQLIMPIIWYAILLVGYFVTGLYLDRRVWILAGWEALVIIMTLLLTSTSTQILGIDLSKNLSLNFGLSSGIPLLIAALPFWKERYAHP
jgi:hypothetical protein